MSETESTDHPRWAVAFDKEEKLQNMVISKAARDEYESVRFFYHSMTDALEGTKYHPKWQKDIYPAQEDLRDAIDKGELYIGRVGDRIAAAMVLNQQYNPEYEDIVWTMPLDRSEFMVIHMLGVHSDFAGRVDFELFELVL